MYNARKVCKLLGLAKSTLLNWEKSGKIYPVKRTLIGNRQYSVDDVVNIIKAMDKPQKAEAAEALRQRLESEIKEIQTVLRFINEAEN